MSTNQQGKLRVELLIIDPQKDFCDPRGALYVQGADQDMERLSTMVDRLSDKIDDIHVTLDSHRIVDIAHPLYWKNSEGMHPNPFTIITVSDVENGVWTTTMPGLYKRALDYVKALEAGGRYPLCIWPEHCRIGSWGHSVDDSVFQAVSEWERKRFAMVDFVTKGSNVYVEHYSAVQAEVPDPADPSTQVNTKLIQTLMNADIVAIAGEASSHCLANTVIDIANNFGDDSYVRKIVFLKDAASPVTGFENYEQDFLAKMTARGMQVSTTADFLN